MPDRPEFVLKSLALLWCSAAARDKADVLLRLVNPDDQAQGRVSSGDADLKAFCMLVFKLAMEFTVEMAKTTMRETFQPSEESPVYEREKLDQAYEALVLGWHEDEDKQGFVTLLFGMEAILEDAKFEELIVEEKCSWIFDAH